MRALAYLILIVIFGTILFKMVFPLFVTIEKYLAISEYEKTYKKTHNEKVQKEVILENIITKEIMKFLIN